MDFVVDIDDPSSWPSEVVGTVEDAIESASKDDWQEFPFDYFGSPKFIEAENHLREQLDDWRLLGYHATRLLPHEIVNIRDRTGLEILTDDMRRRKVEESRTHCPEVFQDDDPEGASLLMSGPNNWQGTADVRTGFINFIVPSPLFGNDARILVSYLRTWGGETLGWSAGGKSTPLLGRLTKMSEPVIVRLGARISTLDAIALLPAFIGRFADVPDRHLRWRTTTESIPAAFTFDIITTASPLWPTTLDKYKLSEGIW